MNVMKRHLGAVATCTAVFAVCAVVRPSAVTAGEPIFTKQQAVHASAVPAPQETSVRPVIELEAGAEIPMYQAFPTDEFVKSPDGYNLPVFRVNRSQNMAEQDSGLRAPPNEVVLYQATGASYYGAADWYERYDFNNVEPVPHAISYVSAFSGDTGTAAYCATDRYHLIEIYADHLCLPPPGGATCTPTCIGVNAIHSKYLGGIVVNLGPHDPDDSICGGPTGSDQDFFRWFVDAGADPFIYRFFAPADGDTVVVHRMGTVSGGQFVPAPAQTDATNISLIFATAAGVVNVGARPGQSLFSDGFGGGGETDRIYTPADGPLTFGGGEGVLDMELRGRPMTDCDLDGMPDDFQIVCFEEPDTGAGSPCAANECAYYAATDTNGFFWNNALFVNPLTAAGCETECISASKDANTNGVLDECACGDCNLNGIPDLCDLDCNDSVPADCSGFIVGLCSANYPGCGQHTDCNNNGALDTCEIAGNDCNSNGILDSCDIANATEVDCQPDGVPDSCQIASGAVEDCDLNGVPDRCERPIRFDCNRNAEEDYCDLLFGRSNDLNSDDIPDECPAELCVELFEEPVGGFEDAAYVIGPLDGIDPNGDGDNWGNGDGGWTVEAGSFTAAPPDGCVGGGAKRIQGAGANSPAGFPQFVFSENFFGSTQRPISALEKLSFDYRVVGNPATASHDLHMQIGNFNNADNALIVRWTSANSDLSTNGAVPGRIWFIGGDGAGGVQYYDSGVAVNTACHRMEVSLNPSTQRVSVTLDGVTIGTNIPTFETCLRLDEIGAGSRTFLAPAGSTTMDMELDNFRWCAVGGAVECSIYKNADGTPGEDCNEDGICDIFQLGLAGADDDANGILDVCQGYCDDCNHNFLADSFEIAQGSLVDANANGIPDVCEPAEYDYDFTAFTVGDVSGQFGWSAFTGVNAVGEIEQSSGMGGLASNKFLVVKKRPTSNSSTGFVLGPRVTMAEAGLEVWAWRMRVRTTTTNDFGRIFVEITDLCEHDPANPNSVADIIAARNVGLQLTRLDTNEGAGALLAGNTANVYILGTPGGVPQYELANPVAITNVYGNVVNATWAAGITIRNNSGLANAYWDSNINDIVLPPAPSATAIRNAQTGETHEQVPDIDGTQRWRGGDRQLWIRQAGGYGTNDDIQFLFDDFRYTAGVDCDGDGNVDSVFIAANPTHDRNGDGIMDRCQDCDDDCPTFPIALTARGCLDPCQVNSAASGCGGLGGTSPDCNGNAIPDACDVDSNRPNQRVAPAFEYFAGGGSCDFDSNGVPDECQLPFTDCNGNGCKDAFELATAGFGGTATDIDNNGTLDECQADCNHNNVPDTRDIALGLAGGGSQDADQFAGPFTNDGFPDECCVQGGVVVAADGDMDNDGDRDSADYQLIQRCGGFLPPNCPDLGCVNGSGTVRGSATGGLSWDGLQCGCADFNGDGLVDECDLQIFQTLITGP